MESAYPLQWPQGRQRTPAGKREWGRFKGHPSDIAVGLREEIERMGGRMAVISTNKRVRRDGLPYASDREPEDPGVAVYFERKGDRVCFA